MINNEEPKTEICKVTSPFEQVGNRIEDICRQLNIDDDINAKLRHCKRELTVNFPVKMDSEEVNIFTGYRVEKGGWMLREEHGDVALEQLSWQCVNGKTMGITVTTLNDEH